MAQTRADILKELAEDVDANWLAGIQGDVDANAVLNALVDMFVVMSNVVDVVTGLALITESPGGAPGTVLMTFTRTASGTSGVIPKGFPFVDDRGLIFTTTAPVNVTTGALAITLPLASVRQTYAVNTFVPPILSVSPQAPVVKDSGGTIVLAAPPGTAGIVATTFQLATAQGLVTGGTSDFLSVLGEERGIIRQPQETEDAYRLRVRNVPDAVAPAALAVGVAGAASRANVAPVLFLEPFNDGASSDVKAQYNLGDFKTLFATGIAGAGPTDPGPGPNTDFFDDTVYEVDGLREARAYFRLSRTLGPPPDPDISRMFFDSWSYYDDPVYGYPDVLQAAATVAALMSVWEEANRKRAGGVQFDFYLDAAAWQIGTGTQIGTALPQVAFTLTPPAGHAWKLVYGFVGHVSSTGSPFDPFTVDHFVRFTFSDSTQFVTPSYIGRDSQLLDDEVLTRMGMSMGKPITLIEGLIDSPGGSGFNLSGAFSVIDMTL